MLDACNLPGNANTAMVQISIVIVVMPCCILCGRFIVMGTISERVTNVTRRAIGSRMLQLDR